MCRLPLRLLHPWPTMPLLLLLHLPDDQQIDLIYSISVWATRLITHDCGNTHPLPVVPPWGRGQGGPIHTRPTGLRRKLVVRFWLPQPALVCLLGLIRSWLQASVLCHPLLAETQAFRPNPVPFLSINDGAPAGTGAIIHGSSSLNEMEGKRALHVPRRLPGRTRLITYLG
ncbi:hypothetical protein F4778DRAFT_472310 [Xylariomycetidae sp. FL2044]|nr:hypothetical protein F4778DRAFT_472310 [Xylariomycetidae sp. FL2044]